MNPDVVNFADKFAAEFYGIFKLKPAGDAVIEASDIASVRTDIIAWDKKYAAEIRRLDAQSVMDVYTLLQQRMASGELGAFDIAFSREDKLRQDRHPLLRVIDFAAHGKRSVLAYSIKDVDGMSLEKSPRAKEFGDHYKFAAQCDFITFIFLDAENHGYYKDQNVPLEQALSRAIAYEKDVAEHAIGHDELVANPDILKQRFDTVVGSYRNRGMGGVHVDVPGLMKWESIADNALHTLTLPELKNVYSHFSSPHEENDVVDVIRKEIESVCMANPTLKKHLKFGFGMDETHCDVRVQHLVSDYRRSAYNIDEAFEKAIADLDKAQAQVPKGPQGMN